VEAEREVLIGLALFVASELIGLSRLKSNSILQLVMLAAMRAFPYELKRRGTVELPKVPKAPVRRTAPRRKPQ
jgi:hypothetical protein